MPNTKARRELLADVEEEIRKHPKWCSETCDRFLPDEYRKARIEDGMSKEAVQKDYDVCHIWR